MDGVSSLPLPPYLNPFYLYYIPSAPLGITSSAVLLTLTTLHLYLLSSTRRLFSIPFFLGGVCATTASIARTVSAYTPASSQAYWTQAVASLIAPVILSAAVYLFLADVVAASTFARYSLLRPVFVANILVWGDVCAALLQCYGAIRLITPDSQWEVGWDRGIVTAGLAVQVLVSVAFGIFAGVFHARLRAHHVVVLTRPGLRFSWSMAAIWGLGSLVLARTMFRLVQYAGPESAYLDEHEWPEYAFNVLIMVVIMLVGVGWYWVDLTVTEDRFEVPLRRIEEMDPQDALRMFSVSHRDGGPVGTKNRNSSVLTSTVVVSTGPASHHV